MPQPQSSRSVEFKFGNGMAAALSIPDDAAKMAVLSVQRESVEVAGVRVIDVSAHRIPNADAREIAREIEAGRTPCCLMHLCLHYVRRELGAEKIADPFGHKKEGEGDAPNHLKHHLKTTVN